MSKPTISAILRERIERLLPKGIPRYVRIYDNEGETWDRYTVVYTGRYPKGEGWAHRFTYLGMSTMPFNPQGFCVHGESERPVDTPWAPSVGKKGHLGKRILFADLNEDCQKAALQTYVSLWFGEKNESAVLHEAYILLGFAPA
jgi:hypothetical protein